MALSASLEVFHKSVRRAFQIPECTSGSTSILPKELDADAQEDNLDDEEVSLDCIVKIVPG